MLTSVLKFAGVYVLVSLVLGTVLLLLGGWLWHPASAVGWTAFFASVLPIMAVGEWLGSVILENRFAVSLDGDKSFSWLRIAYVLAAYLIAFAVVGAIYLAAVSWWG